MKLVKQYISEEVSEKQLKVSSFSFFKRCTTATGSGGRELHVGSHEDKVSNIGDTVSYP